MQKWKKIIKGERGKFVIDLRDSLQTRYEMVRELYLSRKSKERICKGYGYTRASGHIYQKAWGENRWEGLKDKPRALNKITFTFYHAVSLVKLYNSTLD